MITLFNSEEEKKNFLASYNNPFKSENISCVSFWIRKNRFRPDMIEHEADIDFENGNTKGSHTIISHDLPSLIEKTELFINSL